jgi:hypothetical protein
MVGKRQPRLANPVGSTRGVQTPPLTGTASPKRITKTNYRFVCTPMTATGAAAVAVCTLLQLSPS